MTPNSFTSLHLGTQLHNFDISNHNQLQLLNLVYRYCNKLHPTTYK